MLWLSLAFAGGLDACFADPEDTREPYRCAYRFARSSNDYDAVINRVQGELALHPDHAWAIHTLGSLLTDRGQLAEGVEYFEQSRMLFDGGDDVLGRVYCRLNLGTHLQHLERFDESRAAYLEAAAIAEAHDREDLQHAAQLSLARNLVGNDTRLGEAWELAHRVHDQVFPDGAYQTKLLALHVLQQIAVKTGRVEEHAMLLERRIALAVAEEDAYNQYSAQLGLVNTLIDARREGDRRPETLARIEGLLVGLASTGTSDPFFAALGLCAQARLQHHLGQPELARETVLRCLNQVRTLDEPAMLRVALMEHAAIAVGEAADASWREAQGLAEGEDELARLALLRLEMLVDRADREGLRASVPAVRLAVQQLRAAFGDHTSRSGLSNTQLRPLELAAMSLAGEHPDEALLLVDIQRGAAADTPTTLASLQAAVPDDTTLVVYLVPPTQDVGLAMVVSRADLRLVPIHDVQGLPARTRLLTALIQGRDSLADDVARQLHAQLIAPLELASERVVIFPSGVLHGVPFDVLGDGPNRLGEQHIVTLGTTLSAWRTRTSSPDKVAHTVLLGDPLEPGDGLPALPSAQDEVRAVATALGSEAPVWIGADATSSALLDPRADWIHVAAHVVIDDRFPERTAVHLARGELLTAAQVREATWNHPTVVLSACRSVAGPVVGDGPLGMGRAFLDAGAASVIGSLWPLRDDDAKRLFDIFYRRLAEGERLDAALANTRRELAAAGLPHEAWAGVVLVGDGSRQLKVPTSKTWWALVVGGLMLALGLVVGGLALRRR